ncbi:MAG: polymer-forming cytoskeletal protein [Actinomycetota bacterium]|nr:polymer-forming cytoskeletal protein [Actinomycetota bacterium]
MTSRMRRVLGVTAAICVGGAAVLMLGAPALANEDSGDATGPDSAFVVLTGRLDVHEGTTVRTAVIFNGPMAIDGTVTESAVAFNGDISVTGSVGQNVVALNGRVFVGPGARVDGDVVSREAPVISPGATVAGSIRQRDFSFDLGRIGFLGRIAWWVAVSIASLITGLLLVFVWPKAADSLAEHARGNLGPAIGFGALVFFGFPIVAVIAMVTVVGLLFGVELLMASLLVYGIAYAAGTFALGRLLLKPPTKRILAFLLGWGIVRVAALIPVIGGLQFLAFAIWGFGAIVLAARHVGRDAPMNAGPPPPTQPGTLPPMPMPAPGAGG